MDPEILGTLGELERKLAELERTIATLERMEGGSEHREPPAGDGAGEPAAEPAGASGSRLVDESVTGAPAPPADEPTRGRAYTGPAASGPPTSAAPSGPPTSAAPSGPPTSAAAHGQAYTATPAPAPAATPGP